MTARAWIIIGLALAIALATVVARDGGRPRPGAPTEPLAAAPPAPWTAPPQPPRLDPTAADGAPAAEPALAPPPTEPGAYAASLADELCACADGACVDAVNQRFGQHLGQVAATDDVAAIRAAFSRARACTARVRAAAP